MSGEAAGKNIDELFQTLSTTQNGSAAAAGQEHSSSSTSSDELIRQNHHQLAGDHQPLLLPVSRSSEEAEQEVNENSCTDNDNNNSSSEAAATEQEQQPQMDSTTTPFEAEDDDTAAGQMQERFPPLTGEGDGDDMSQLMINLNQDLNFGGDPQEISTADAAEADGHHQLHNINTNGAPSPTLFGFNLSSLTPSNTNTINLGEAGGEVDVHFQQQQQQLPSTNFFIGHDIHHVPNNNVAFGNNNNNNGVVISHFNVNAPPPSWPQEMPSFAQSVLPTTHESYGASPPPPQFHQLLPPPHHYQMQMTWPETMIQQQPSHDVHHHQYSQWSPVHGLQRISSHRAAAPDPASASASASRRQPYMPNSLYDPSFELMGLPADPFLRLLVSNPNFADRRRRN